MNRARPDPILLTGRDWYRVVNADGGNGDEDTAEVWIYDTIGWDVEAGPFARDLAQITAKKIVCRLNTPGGSVFDGIAIYNALLSHPAEVTVQVDGLAASAGSFIAQAGDRVVMGRNSQMMIHDAAGVCFGNAGDMRELADLLDRLSDNIASVYSDRAGGTVEQWRERMLAETWFGADEAVKAGLADEMAPPPKRRGDDPDEDGDEDPDEEPDEDEPEPDEDEPDPGMLTRRHDLAAFGYAGPGGQKPGSVTLPGPVTVTWTGSPPTTTSGATATTTVTGTEGAPPIGERGPELVVLPPGATVKPATGGVVTNAHVFAVRDDVLVDLEALRASLRDPRAPEPAADPASTDPEPEPDGTSDEPTDWAALTSHLIPTTDDMLAALRA
jgi:ATP-dependent protease ClpP protease subunit